MLFRHSSFSKLHEYIYAGYQAPPDIEPVGFPTTVTVCVQCLRLLDPSEESAIRHCDTTQHLLNMTDILDLERPLQPSGVVRPGSKDDVDMLAQQMAAIGMTGDR